MELNGYKSTADALLELGQRYQFAKAELNPDCLTVSEVDKFAHSQQQLLFHQKHLRECVRCQSWFDLFRGVRAIETMPASWSLAVGPESRVIEPTFSQTLGFVRLESQKFQSCEEEILWTPSPSSMRLNLVVDSELGSVSLSLLEVPDNIERIFVVAYGRPVPLEASHPKGSFEFNVFESNFGNMSNETHVGLFDRVFGEEVKIEFETCQMETDTAGSLPLKKLLDSFGGFEDEYEYVLPSGNVCEIHFNLAKLCGHESVLLRLATELDRILPNDIDVVVSNSWAMAMIARRFMRLRNLRNGIPSTREILCEGYSKPVLTDTVHDGERVAIVTDVAVTGRQINAIAEQVKKKGGLVLSKAALVASMGADFDFELKRLLTVDLKIQRSVLLKSKKERLHFNPIANAMTVKKDSRAPSQFLKENKDAADVWSFLCQVVDETKGSGVQYYKRHHVERGTHYTQFIDTGRLLQHRKFGPQLIERMRHKLAADSIVPDVFIVPKRRRAELFAEHLLSTFEFKGGRAIKILKVEKDRDGFWRFPVGAREELENKHAMIVDTAVGSGKTVDLFGMAATEYMAKSVGVCCILSRLPESAELAFATRFSGGFYRIFNIPARPVVVRGTSKNDCPYCFRKETLKKAAELSGSQAIQELASLRRRIVINNDGEPVNAPAKQLSLFDPPSIDVIFETCTPTIAGGITLHSLSAAQNNGMATLILPEIRNSKIPSRNREAMVQDLPIGAMEWSKGDLDNDLLQSMKEIELPSLWGASAVALANERYTDWFCQLDSVVERSIRLQKEENVTFWQRLSYSAYMAVCDMPESEVEVVTNNVRELMDFYSETSAEQGLQKVLDSIVNYRVPSCDSPAPNMAS